MYCKDITGMGLNLSQAGPQVPQALAVLAKATRGAGGPGLPGLALPRAPTLWPLRAPSHLTPVPGPSRSAAAPRPPPCPGRAAPGAAGLPGVVVKRRGEGGEGLCPNPKPTHSLPGPHPSGSLEGHGHSPAARSPHSSPKCPEQTRPREVQCPTSGHTAYWGRAGHRTGPGPTQKGDQPRQHL